ncbi:MULTISPECIES: cytochrome P450 [Streptomyces]|uniref:Cytochrome P450 n=1 Tax=Streptomyces koelreuteriae TaxID=2838015 RepID=A0ABX8G010_9ACTN|nr:MULTISPECIES: cytochrome P450 [Streptomyces]QWB26696.1 cytochrome P450 [Streptomyces koelreuteriae]UUA09776.1 cytochrome P450 [Streptomyces koelreuteriae]UUA17381.1 cytochrome P450 [Streptomyces sp. CRCS-T-1]
MTPESHAPTDTDASRPGPPPGCPAHGLGPGGLHRLHESEDLGALYEQLRKDHGPVAPVLLHDDVPIWVVLGHAENLHMVRSPSQFCRDSRIWTPLKDGLVKPDHPLMPHIAWQPIASHAEGDEHKRLRGAVMGAISTIDFRSLRRYINRSTQAIVNRFCEQGEADLVGQFAEHLPMAVMCEILGMADEYNDRLVEAARDALKGTETAIASHSYVMDALSRLTARRRAQPEEDFASYLITHPARLTDDEVREHLRLVLFAAYEATTNLLSNVLLTVLIDPRFRAQLNGGQMTVPEAVEQSLWNEPPFSTVFAYFAKQETELGGQRIRRGDGLLFAPAPANVDPRVRPDLSASMQGNRSHLAFGGGPHECPGQDVGRSIADVGVDALLMRLPDVELDCDEEELRWTASIASRHLVEMPVQFSPKPPQDVTEPPSHKQVPAQRSDWQIGSPQPQAAPAAAQAAPSVAQPASPAAAQPYPAPAQPQSAPVYPQVQPTAQEPVRGKGAWQRFLSWWRGY